jgi:hypothetical protein
VHGNAATAPAFRTQLPDERKVGRLVRARAPNLIRWLGLPSDDMKVSVRQADGDIRGYILAKAIRFYRAFTAK